MKYQLINWFPEWQGIGFIKSTYGLALIYDWYLYLGYLEVRKWHDLKNSDIEKYNKITD